MAHSPQDFIDFALFVVSPTQSVFFVQIPTVFGSMRLLLLLLSALLPGDGAKDCKIRPYEAKGPKRDGDNGYSIEIEAATEKGDDGSIGFVPGETYKGMSSAFKTEGYRNPGLGTPCKNSFFYFLLLESSFIVPQKFAKKKSWGLFTFYAKMMAIIEVF